MLNYDNADEQTKRAAFDLAQALDTWNIHDDESNQCIICRGYDDKHEPDCEYLIFDRLRQ